MERLFKNKETQMLVGEFCREFRIDVLGLTLREVMGDENVKTLSAFEHGRSSNLLILLEYWRLAKIHGELNRFDVMLEAVIEISTGEDLQLKE